MKRILIALLFIIFLLTACTPAKGTVVPEAPGPRSEPEPATQPAPVGTGEPAPIHPSDAPLYLTTMTHMEQNFNDDKNQNLFQIHIQQLTFGMDMADQYGARLTIETEQPFAIANTKWGRNFMAEIVARGHGVGTHCDFGFKDNVMPVEQYAQYFIENKSLVDALVGAENNLGCSGGGGANDWALAASMAGFKFIDGVVGMHYLSMPLENRPDSTWTDKFIEKTGYHFNAPVDLYQRIYPFGVADAKDFVADPNPVIVVSSGELGLLSGMQENVGEVNGQQCRPECAFTNADVDALVAKIRQVDQNRDRSRIAKLTVYIPVNFYTPEYEPVMRYFFEQMQTLANQGIIHWATQKQVYEAYMAWNE